MTSKIERFLYCECRFFSFTQTWKPERNIAESAFWSRPIFHGKTYFFESLIAMLPSRRDLLAQGESPDNLRPHKHLFEHEICGLLCRRRRLICVASFAVVVAACLFSPLLALLFSLLCCLCVCRRREQMQWKVARMTVVFAEHVFLPFWIARCRFVVFIFMSFGENTHSRNYSHLKWL